MVHYGLLVEKNFQILQNGVKALGLISYSNQTVQEQPMGSQVGGQNNIRFSL